MSHSEHFNWIVIAGYQATVDKSQRDWYKRKNSVK